MFPFRKGGRRAAALLASTLILSLVVAGCGSNSAKPAESAKPKVTHPHVTIAAVANHWTVMVVPYVALDKGYWAEEGLTDIDIKAVGPAATHVAAFVGGSIDFSLNLSTDTMARSNAKGGKVYAISGSTNGNSYVLFGRKGITSIADLKGKSIAIDTVGGTSHLMSSDIVKKGGLTPGTDVTFITVAGTISERLQAMLGGAADAALATIAEFPALEPQGVSILGKATDVYPDWQFAVHGASGKMLEQNPQTVTAFLKGMIKAYKFLADPKNDQEAAAILKKHEIPFDEKLWSQSLAVQRPFWPTKDGSPNMKGIEVVVEREQEAKRIDASYKVDQLMRLDPLKQAQKELGL